MLVTWCGAAPVWTTGQHAGGAMYSTYNFTVTDYVTVETRYYITMETLCLSA